MQPAYCQRLNTRLFAVLMFVLFYLATSLQPVTAQQLGSPTQRSLVQQTVVPTPNVTNTIARIRQRGDMLIVGVLYDYEPFGAFDASGNAVGFEVELVQALAAQWGIEVTFVPVTPSTRLQSLLAGQIDLLAAAVPHTISNEAIVDFSTHYLQDTDALLLPVQSQISSFQALSGKTVATIQGDSAASKLTAYLASIGVTVQILPFQEPASALAALKAGQADALVGDRAYLSLIAQEQLTLSVLLALPGTNHFGFALAPGDSYMRNLVNATLQEFYTNGTYATIYAKWFPAVSATDAVVDGIKLDEVDGMDAEIPQLPILPGNWPYTIDSTPAQIVAPRQSQLAILRERGKLFAGVPYDMPPFGYIDSQGNLIGFEIDLAREFARRWLGDGDTVEFVRVTPDTAIPLLNAGQVDLLAAALPQSWALATEVDWGPTYFEDELATLVDASRGYTTLFDLNGGTVAAVAGHSNWQETAELLREQFAIEPAILPFQEYRPARQALRAGQVDAVLGSNAVLSETQKTDINLRLLDADLPKQPHAIGVHLFDAELRDLVDVTLQVMKIDGTYDQIYRRWFSGESYAIPLWIDQYDLQLAPSMAETTREQTLLAAAESVPQVNLPTASPLTPVPLQVNTPAVATVVTPLVTSTAARPTPSNTRQPTLTPRPSATVRPTITPVSTPEPVGTATSVTLVLRPTSLASTAVAEAVVAEEELTVDTDLLTATTTLIETLIEVSLLTETTPFTLTPLVPTTLSSTAILSATSTPTALPTDSLPDGPTLRTVTVLTGININARREPSITAPILMVVSGGTEWPVLALSDDGEWVQLALPGGVRGWVAQRLLAEADHLNSGASGPVDAGTDAVGVAVATATASPTVAITPEPSTAAPAATPTPRLLFSTTTTHQIRATDSLASIAQEYYGQQSLWILIYETNRDLIGDDPNVIPTGVELIIPPRP